MSPRITGVASEPGYTIVENAPLEGRNTFRVPARAELLIDVNRLDGVADLFKQAALQNPVRALGAGRNILFTRDWPGA